MTLCSEVLSILDRLQGVELDSSDLESVSHRLLRVGSARYRITLITADVCTCFVERWHGHRVHAPMSFRTAHEFADFLLTLDLSSENDHFEALREASSLSGEDTE